MRSCGNPPGVSGRRSLDCRDSSHLKAKLPLALAQWNTLSQKDVGLHNCTLCFHPHSSVTPLIGTVGRGVGRVQTVSKTTRRFYLRLQTQARRRSRRNKVLAMRDCLNPQSPRQIPNHNLLHRHSSSWHPLRCKAQRQLELFLFLIVRVWMAGTTLGRR